MQTTDVKAADLQQLSLLSPAKINVFFKVLRKRQDGFHEISSLYQAIDLCDRLQVRLSEKDQFFCSNPLLSLDDTNLVSKALDLFRKETGSSACFSIYLDKKIPMQAGLGGGSSNAATALWAFAALTGMKVSQETFYSWGAKLGSDVPFFFSSGAAMASGRGEVLSETKPYLYSPFFVVKPKGGLSTPAVYQACRPSLKERAEGDMLYNDLEEAAFCLEPSLKELKESLLKFGFSSVLLSGSGTAFFCLPKEERVDLLKMQKEFPQLQIFSVKPLQRKHLRWYE